MPSSESFWEKVAVGEPDECWEWQSFLTPSGYGQWHPHKGYKVMAHRFAYEDRIGPIPEGLVIDHLCRHRACCNPAHMEPVSIGENVMRGETLPSLYAKRTHCGKGHQLADSNLRKDRGRGRECRQCDLERKRRSYIKKRATV